MFEIQINLSDFIFDVGNRTEKASWSDVRGATNNPWHGLYGL